MAKWEYRVAYVDFRGRVSIEGQEILIEKGERRSAFVRTVLDHLGGDGWELAGVHPLWPAETSYMIFKRESTGKSDASGDEAQTGGEADSDAGENLKSSKGSEGGEPTRNIADDATDMV